MSRASTGFTEIQRLLQSRCALTVQAASKTGANDGSLVVTFQIETTCSEDCSTVDTISESPLDQKSVRLVECELSPAQLFTILAVLEEAHAKLVSRSEEQ